MPAVVRDGGNYTGHYWVGGGWLLQGLPTHIHDDDDHHDDDDGEHDNDVLWSRIIKNSHPLDSRNTFYSPDSTVNRGLTYR